VGTGTKGFWVIGLYDMVLLEDGPYSESDFAMGIGSFPTIDVTVTATPTFVEDNPELVEFIENYHTNSAAISEALAYMMENEVEADVAAQWFLLEKQDIWTEWVDDEVAEKVIDAIQFNE
jgi:glycine betaine/proline transport system substrate-binding protein